VRKLSILICADVAVAVWFIAWIGETKVNEPYECDGVCEGLGIFAGLLLVGLLYATWRTAQSEGEP
jgi:hypothetical protein